MLLLFLSSGLFLGWSLGANDASNVFGGAVATKMLRFRTAAWICSIFVLLGALFGGAGPANTLGSLGAVSELPAAFSAALSAAVVVSAMTRLSMPVSVSQAIVGSIIGWNIFSNTATEAETFGKITLSWIASPILAAIFAVLLYVLFKKIINRVNVHLLYRDSIIRTGLLIAGAFGSYSLGANNIANVMGLFTKSNPFTEIIIFNSIVISPLIQLFFLGAVAISIGVFTYSKRVMNTVGKGIFRLSPEMALVVVLAQSLVLFLFSSQNLESLLHSFGLPAIPLVPVSSSHAIIGAVMGIGLYKSARSIRYGIAGEIALGWIITPLLSGILNLLFLFLLQNLFHLRVV